MTSGLDWPRAFVEKVMCALLLLVKTSLSVGRTGTVGRGPMNR